MKKTITLALTALISQALYAANHEIRMLDFSDDGKEPMVFDPPYIKIEKGDSITFLPTHKSHYVQSRLVPEGAEEFLSELDKEFTITLNEEGIYLYVCPPHQMMNMVGIIQVGEATNLEAVEKAIPRLERRAMSNKGRFEQYAQNIDGYPMEKEETQP